VHPGCDRHSLDRGGELPKSSRDDASREMEDRIMLLENLLQPTHLVLVLAIALLVFGPKNLPEIGAGLGRAIRVESRES
jgi:TatA/E family protein of Tat protein translocase